MCLEHASHKYEDLFLVDHLDHHHSPVRTVCPRYLFAALSLDWTFFSPLQPPDLHIKSRGLQEDPYPLRQASIKASQEDPCTPELLPLRGYFLQLLQSEVRMWLHLPSSPD
ncbi:hypothetical protein AMECASPLE_034886 [Ameca splendens]|uniref:Uncharacterized protein n=1 Tax=Ameca splendens TaxID=208324 RepID=A0ABV0Y7J8_9TELE